MKKPSIPLEELIAKARIARDAAVDICDKVERFSEFQEAVKHSPIVMRYVDLFERSAAGLDTSSGEIKRVLAHLTAAIEKGRKKGAAASEEIEKRSKKRGS